MEEKVKIIHEGKYFTIGKLSNNAVFISSSCSSSRQSESSYTNFTYYPAVASNEGQHEVVIFNGDTKEKTALKIFELLETVGGRLDDSLSFIENHFSSFNQKVDLRKLGGAIGELTFLLENSNKQISYADANDPIDFIIDGDLFEIKTMIGNSKTINLTKQQIFNSDDISIIVYSASISSNGVGIKDLLSKMPQHKERYKELSSVKNTNDFKFEVSFAKKLISKDIAKNIKINADEITNFKIELMINK